MLDALHWAVTHPFASILSLTAVPIVAVCVNALLGRGAPPRDLEPPARDVAPPAPAAPVVETAPAPAVDETLEPREETGARAATPASAPPAEPAAAEPPRAPAPPRVGLRERLSRTSESLVGRLGGLLGGRQVDAALLDELEAMLFTADLGVATAESLLQTVKKEASGGDASAVRGVLARAIREKLERVQPDRDAPLPSTDGLTVILVLGVNGSGKTTSIGKLAARYARAGKRVILGAGDTFRAAATGQLQVWGERVGCEVVTGLEGSDPTAVAFDTVKAAKARGADVAIIDTAGRLQTKKPLMEELAKLSRVIGREIPDAPHQTLLVLDANTGQNAISQARLFTEVTNVTDLVLTKLDGTAKGGVIVGLADEFGIPVRYVGVGETAEDLRDFDAAEFVDALFGTESAGA